MRWKHTADVDRLAHDVHAVLGLVVEDALEARFPFREAVLGVAHVGIEFRAHRQRLVDPQHGPRTITDGVEVLADADHVTGLELRLALQCAVFKEGSYRRVVNSFHMLVPVALRRGALAVLLFQFRGPHLLFVFLEVF